jgi:hypothetical protein
MDAQEMLVGNWVAVRSAGEILSTLDSNGTLDGLPFMPEMLSWCGKSFRVQRRVDKTCVADAGSLRHFPKGDVVILDGPRCDGNAHDGCKHGCRIFWKEAWLRPLDADDAGIERSDGDLNKLSGRLKVKSDEHHYFCQSTELLRSTEVLPPKRHRSARIALTEIRNGDIRIWRALQLLALYLRQKILRKLGCDDWLRGPHKSTPTQSLKLRPGELVRVKSRAQIVQTLDHRMFNRGMVICYEMVRCCGRQAEVRYRVDRLIDEKTGLMREIADTVVLGSMRGCGSLGEECLCYGEPGDCPRGELMYWREIWLERVHS